MYICSLLLGKPNFVGPYHTALVVRVIRWYTVARVDEAYNEQ